MITPTGVNIKGFKEFLLVECLDNLKISQDVLLRWSSAKKTKVNL